MDTVNFWIILGTACFVGGIPTFITLLVLYDLWQEHITEINWYKNQGKE